MIVLLVLVVLAVVCAVAPSWTADSRPGVDDHDPWWPGVRT